jgi:hypothetical protein
VLFNRLRKRRKKRKRELSLRQLILATRPMEEIRRR